MSVAYSRAEAMHPEDPAVARSLLGLANLPTVVAIGPFDDLAHAHHLAAAFTVLQRVRRSQLVLLGTGTQRAAVRRAVPGNGGTRVHMLYDSSRALWSNVMAAADVVVLSAASGAETLLDVMAAGRAVVAPVDPATVRLIVPRSVGLVYPPGDVHALTAAISRLLTTPEFCHQMATRASEAARRHRLERIRYHEKRERERT
jgi:glycosyltransferase involved in cell wall biosynthesis